MANTFTQRYIHLVFAVDQRQKLIQDRFKPELYRFITGIIRQRGQKLIAINGMPDHVHLLVGLRPEMALSNLVRDIKAFSSGHVNTERWVRGTFRWQEGFGAFSYSRSQIASVVRYIENQEQHHRRMNFREEYLDLLRAFEVEYDERYLFRWS